MLRRSVDTDRQPPDGSGDRPAVTAAAGGAATGVGAAPSTTDAHGLGVGRSCTGHRAGCAAARCPGRRAGNRDDLDRRLDQSVAGGSPGGAGPAAITRPARPAGCGVRSAHSGSGVDRRSDRRGSAHRRPAGHRRCERTSRPLGEPDRPVAGRPVLQPRSPPGHRVRRPHPARPALVIPHRVPSRALGGFRVGQRVERWFCWAARAVPGRRIGLGYPAHGYKCAERVSGAVRQPGSIATGGSTSELPSATEPGRPAAVPTSAGQAAHSELDSAAAESAPEPSPRQAVPGRPSPRTAGSPGGHSEWPVWDGRFGARSRSPGLRRVLPDRTRWQRAWVTCRAGSTPGTPARSVPAGQPETNRRCPVLRTPLQSPSAVVGPPRRRPGLSCLRCCPVRNKLRPAVRPGASVRPSWTARAPQGGATAPAGAASPATGPAPGRTGAASGGSGAGRSGSPPSAVAMNRPRGGADPGNRPASPQRGAARWNVPACSRRRRFGARQPSCTVAATTVRRNGPDDIARAAVVRSSVTGDAATNASDAARSATLPAARATTPARLQTPRRRRPGAPRDRARHRASRLGHAAGGQPAAVRRASRHPDRQVWQAVPAADGRTDPPAGRRPGAAAPDASPGRPLGVARAAIRRRPATRRRSRLPPPDVRVPRPPGPPRPAHRRRNRRRSG